MEHIFYQDGSPKKISWVLTNDDEVIEESRDHAEIYLDKVTNEQSKYIAYHVGVFWSIGTFRIKDEDTVIVMLDSKSMYEHLENGETPDDDFIKQRTSSIIHQINQRKLKIKYQLIDSKENLASKLIK